LNDRANREVKIFETIPDSAGDEEIKMMQNFGAEVVVLDTIEVKKLENKSVPRAEIGLPGRRICLDLERTTKMFGGLDNSAT
jgi:hypothetical protein